MKRGYGIFVLLLVVVFSFGALAVVFQGLNEERNVGVLLGPGDSCFDVSAFPGCVDEVCEETICAIDPYCCDVSWDGICVEEAGDFCSWFSTKCGDGIVQKPNDAGVNEECDDGNVENGDGCNKYCKLEQNNDCGIGEIRCQVVVSKPPVCCNPDVSNCGDLGSLASLVNENANICEPKEEGPSNFCEKNFPGKPQECTKGGKTTCCEKEDICSAIDVGPLGNNVPVCVGQDPKSCVESNPKNNDPDDIFFCAKTHAGNMCCKENQECIKKEIPGDDYFYCLNTADSCKQGESYCPGKDEFNPSGNSPASLCCGPGYECGNQPNGLPKCEKIETAGCEDLGYCPLAQDDSATPDGICYCDEVCESYGDCCEDYYEFCKN